MAPPKTARIAAPPGALGGRASGVRRSSGGSRAHQPIVTVSFWVTDSVPDTALTVTVAVFAVDAGVPDSVAVPLSLSWNVRPARCAGSVAVIAVPGFAPPIVLTV